MEVEISNSWPSYAGEDHSSTSLLARTDKFMIAVATRQECLKCGVSFQEDRASFNARIADELDIPRVILDVLKETGDLTDED